MTCFNIPSLALVVETVEKRVLRKVVFAVLCLLLGLTFGASWGWLRLPLQWGQDQNPEKKVWSRVLGQAAFALEQPQDTVGASFESEKVAELSSQVKFEIRKLLEARKREEALERIRGLIQNAKRAERLELIRQQSVVSRLFLTNQTFQIYQDGLNFMAGKKYSLAREKLERANSQEPDNVEVLFRLGQCLFLEGNWKRAVDHFRSARKLDPYDPEIRLWLGRTYYLQGQFTESVPELRAGFRELSASENAPVWLAEALFSSGQTHSALKILDQDAKLHPLHLTSLMMGARMRIQLPHLDSQSLWVARKNLQLALSRVDHYRASSELQMDLRKSPEDLKLEIQKLLQQVQNRIDQMARS